MLTRYNETTGEYNVLAAGAQRYWHGTRAAFDQVKDDIPNNTMICITDDNDAPADTGPIGSVVDYEGSTAPEGYLFCDGSTFDRTEYPDLYLFLGIDKLPYIGGKLTNQYEDVTIGSSLAAAYTATYDCVLYMQYSNSGPNRDTSFYISRNGVTTMVSSTPNPVTQWVSNTVELKAGDAIYYADDLPSNPVFRVYKKRPKIIKAVSNMSVSDASALMTQIIQHMTLDYANATTITSLPFTAPQRGMLFLSVGAVTGGDGSRTFYIDGVQVGWFGRASATVRTTLTFPIDKDQVFTSDYSIWGTYRFVPYK